MKPSEMTVIDKIHAWWTYNEGLRKSGEYYVRYPDGVYSVPMPFGNAISYAKIFKGEVFKI